MRGLVVLVPVAIVAACGAEPAGESAAPPGEQMPQARDAAPAEAPREAGTRSDDGAVGGCPFPVAKGTPVPRRSDGSIDHSVCPERCGAVEGLELDEANECVQEVLLGCLPFPIGGGATTVCGKYLDGRVVQAPHGSLFGQPGWSECTELERYYVNHPNRRCSR